MKIKVFGLFNICSGGRPSEAAALGGPPPRDRRHFDLPDAIRLSGLTLFTLFYSLRSVNFAAYPAEDAAMLLRYAAHLASGHGIVWNIGDPPVDGATDFLFLLAVAVLAKVGFTLEAAVRSLDLASHLATTALIYLAVTRLQQAPQWMAYLSAAFFAMGPGLNYTSACFGTPFFALWAATTWYLAMSLAQEAQPGMSGAIPFASAALLLGLARPEGVFLAVFVLVALVVLRGIRATRPVVGCFLAVFVVIGGAYFLWRWQYFGYPLPNPFYVKGGGAIYPGNLIRAAKNTLSLAGPFASILTAAGYYLVAALFLRPRESSIRALAFGLLPVVGFTSIWVLLSNEMNFRMRFQYASLPLVLMSWPGLLKHLLPSIRLAGYGKTR